MKKRLTFFRFSKSALMTTIFILNNDLILFFTYFGETFLIRLYFITNLFLIKVLLIFENTYSDCAVVLFIYFSDLRLLYILIMPNLLRLCL